MTAHTTVGRVGGFTRIATRYRAEASGAVVTLALASGMAIGFGAVVERLSTSGVAVVDAGEAVHGGDPPWFFYDEEDGTVCDRAPCPRIRRWLPNTLVTGVRSPR